MNDLIGRKKEIKTLEERYNSPKSELVVLYGRRRVGKTFLVKKCFANNLFFSISGVDNNEQENLANFQAELHILNCSDYRSCFFALKDLIIASKLKKKVIFLDEFVWFASNSLNFMSAFSYFWNNFCSTRDDCMIIISGSATSWIVKNILGNTAELYRRMTCVINLLPFNLFETQEFLKSRNINYEKSDIVMCYMVFGGIPYYLEYIDQSLSAIQNIDSIVFSNNSFLKNEQYTLFKALFKNSSCYEEVIGIIAEKHNGMNRIEIASKVSFSDGGTLSSILEDLELSGIIRAMNKYPNNVKKGKVYILIDNYLTFYYNVVKKNNSFEENFWKLNNGKPSFYQWRGIAFEQVCFQHINQIKHKINILGVSSKLSFFSNEKAQIDLVIDRNDNVINLCEIKYTDKKFAISSEYYENLINKKNEFFNSLKRRKTILMTLISFNGLVINEYSNVFSLALTIDDLFVDI
jgi:AAA+ ATPase superfamily predicted ATPase